MKKIGSPESTAYRYENDGRKSSNSNSNNNSDNNYYRFHRGMSHHSNFPYPHQQERQQPGEESKEELRRYSAEKVVPLHLSPAADMPALQLFQYDNNPYHSHSHPPSSPYDSAIPAVTLQQHPHQLVVSSSHYKEYGKRDEDPNYYPQHVNNSSVEEHMSPPIHCNSLNGNNYQHPLHIYSSIQPPAVSANMYNPQWSSLPPFYFVPSAQMVPSSHHSTCTSDQILEQQPPATFPVGQYYHAQSASGSSVGHHPAIHPHIPSLVATRPSMHSQQRHTVSSNPTGIDCLLPSQAFNLSHPTGFPIPERTVAGAEVAVTSVHSSLETEPYALQASVNFESKRSRMRIRNVGISSAKSNCSTASVQPSAFELHDSTTSTVDSSTPDRTPHTHHHPPSLCPPLCASPSAHSEGSTRHRNSISRRSSNSNRPSSPHIQYSSAPYSGYTHNEQRGLSLTGSSDPPPFLPQQQHLSDLYYHSFPAFMHEEKQQQYTVVAPSAYVQPATTTTPGGQVIFLSSPNYGPSYVSPFQQSRYLTQQPKQHRPAQHRSHPPLVPLAAAAVSNPSSPVQPSIPNDHCHPPVYGVQAALTQETLIAACQSTRDQYSPSPVPPPPLLLPYGYFPLSHATHQLLCHPQYASVTDSFLLRRIYPRSFMLRLRKARHTPTWHIVCQEQQRQPLSALATNSNNETGALGPHPCSFTAPTDLQPPIVSQPSRKSSPDITQRMRRRSLESEDEESLLRRHVKSLLNKLTIELFEKVAVQLADSLAQSSSGNHIRIHADEVFLKAIAEPNFSDMYVDLVIVLFATSPNFVVTTLLDGTTTLIKVSTGEVLELVNGATHQLHSGFASSPRSISSASCGASPVVSASALPQIVQRSTPQGEASRRGSSEQHNIVLALSKPWVITAKHSIVQTLGDHSVSQDDRNASRLATTHAQAPTPRSRALSHTDIDDSEGAKEDVINFRIEFLNRCQNEFDELIKHNALEFDRAADMTQEDYDLEIKRRKIRVLGNIRFIGELSIKSILKLPITRRVAQDLLSEVNPHEHFIECACELFTTIGSFMEQNANTARTFDALMHKLEVLKESGHYSSRIHFKIQDLVELRANEWRVKLKGTEKATTLNELHRKVAEEDAQGGSIVIAQRGQYTTAGVPSPKAYDRYLAPYRRDVKLLAKPSFTSALRQATLARRR